MNPEAIQDQIETQLIEFFRGNDFKIVSRAVSRWSVEEMDSVNPILKVWVVGEKHPLEFEIILKWYQEVEE